jgi:hypothetical protein
MLPFCPWLVLAVALSAGSDRPAEGPSRELFNGKDFTGWVIDGPKEFKEKGTGKVKPNWFVRDGSIVAGGSFGFLRYDREFSDFALHLEFRLEKGGNGGLGIRTTVFDPKKSRETRPSFYCYEIQLQDDFGKSADEHCSGSLYRYVAPKVNAVKPAGEWNTVDVECIGPHIKVTINGQLVQDVDQTTIPRIKDKPLKGYVCVQSHSKEVEYRNVRVREIKTAGKAGG